LVHFQPIGIIIFLKMPKIRQDEQVNQDDLVIEWKCPNCGSEDIQEDVQAGDLVCQDCGRVVGDRIIRTDKEWREFQDDTGSKSKSRVGGPENPFLENSALSTSISQKGGFVPLLKTQTRISTGKDSSLKNAFKKIDEFAARMSVPQIVKDRSKEIWKSLDDAKAVKGRNSEALIAACIYIGCREYGYTRSFSELDKFVSTSTTKQHLKSCFSHVVKVLGIQMDAVDHSNFTNLWGDRLGLPVKLSTVATHVAKTAVERGVTAGRAPTTVAAAALYLVCGLTEYDEKGSLKEIATQSGVAEGTIKLAYKEMEVCIKDLLPDNFDPKQFLIKK
jgi:transcription initiation factor TFIIB